MSLPLSELAVNTPATVLSVQVEDALRQRLQALGLREGKSIQVMRRASLNGPLQIRLGTTDLVIRRQVAQHISVCRGTR